jgi:hypothetical protein
VYGPTWLLGDIQLLTNPALRQKLHVNLTNSLKHEMRSKSNGMFWAKKFLVLLFIFVIFSWPFNYLASGSLDETKC